ncbi:hypothetical protein ACO22_04813 [Paracoccidioides brasiliensis]|uniref:RRM domain-containing protein n=1 Tax=Paracoccidioides brasiliensis TaxID=121759 RepID=A0A1D2JC67_PARBR|nr:hypothetical protein ACO22_04813 [Paracoccidioides brasiliensis]
MAAGKQAVSFDEIIQAARQRRRKQALTDKFFETKRRSSAPVPGPGSGLGSGSGALADRVSAAPGSLASRAGISKRSAAPATRSFASALPTYPSKLNRTVPDLFPENGQASVQNQGLGYSIKGTASGPCMVLGSNFAPGTTAADIESALEPVGGRMLNCRIVSTHPIVVAEMVFEERSGAEAVVARFNNQKADGRILSVRIKPGPTPQIPTETNDQTPLRHHRSQPNFENLREQADRERREREQRRADPQIQDGRYGFDEFSQQQHRGGASDARVAGCRRRDRSWSGAGTGGLGRSQRSGNGDTGLYSDRMVIDKPGSESRNREGRGR